MLLASKINDICIDLLTKMLNEGPPIKERTTDKAPSSALQRFSAADVLKRQSVVSCTYPAGRNASPIL